MAQPIEFRIYTPASTGRVDSTNCIIHGVSLMQGNVTAKGHDLEVDMKTLEQVLTLGRAKGKIPVKLNHGSGIENLNGFIDGTTLHLDLSDKSRPKVRGDWHLLKSHDETPKMLERAEKQPETFGMSAAFVGGGEKQKSGKNAARCTELKAVDCVTDPAANEGGLFAAKPGPVDSRGNGMADNNTNTQQAQLPADTPEWAKSLFQKLDGMESRMKTVEDFNKQVNEHLSRDPQNEHDLAELANMTDEQLAELGYDAAQVRAAVDAAVASGELTVQEGGPNDGAASGPQGGDAGAGAAAGAGAGAGAAAGAFDSKVRNIIQFELAKARTAAASAAEQQQAQIAFEAIEQHVVSLEAKVREQETALAAKDTQISALQLTLKTTVGAPSAQSAAGDVMFAAKCNAGEGTFEKLVNEKFHELKAKTANISEAAARSQAIQFTVRQHPGAFSDYRARGGKIELAAK